MKQEKKLLYLRIANNIEQQIMNEVLRIGDKLPSLRTICREYGVSQSTALQAYYHLESKSLIEPIPQSGYYVCHSPSRMPLIPLSSRPDVAASNGNIDELVTRVYDNFRDDSNTTLSLGVPANELLPVAKLNKGLVQAMRMLKGNGVAYEQVQGNEKLRKQIARWSFAMEAALHHVDIVTTAGCLDALSYCMRSLTAPGDTIVVESPVSFGMLQLAQSLEVKVIEMPTHPRTGIEIEALKKALAAKKIKLCLLISNFSNPLGSCMPDEHKKEVVRLMEKYNTPLIENDLNGDIYFSRQRPKSCKTYDESGLVLWCGSVSKTLAPGYRVGWVAPGRFKEQILRMKRYHAISSTALTQEVVASFLENGRYENHLRKLRHTLETNCLQFTRAISEYFPEGTRASRPQGGFVLWVELPKKIDTLELYEKARLQKIIIAPGRMFTLQKQFDNCMRLNYGLLWNDKLDLTLKTLGNLAKRLM